MSSRRTQRRREERQQALLDKTKQHLESRGQFPSKSGTLSLRLPAQSPQLLSSGATQLAPAKKPRVRIKAATYTPPILYIHPLVICKMMAGIAINPGLEVGGFMEMHPDNLLYAIDMHFPKQYVQPAFVDFDEDSMSELLTAWRAANPTANPARLGTHWWHHHPGGLSNHPSGVDNATFREEFGPNNSADFATMIISCNQAGTPIPALRAEQQVTACGLSIHLIPEIKVRWDLWNDFLSAGGFNYREWMEAHRPLILLESQRPKPAPSPTTTSSTSSPSTTGFNGSYAKGRTNIHIATIRHKLSDRWEVFRSPSGLWWIRDSKNPTNPEDDCLSNDAFSDLEKAILMAECYIRVTEELELEQATSPSPSTSNKPDLDLLDEESWVKTTTEALIQGGTSPSEDTSVPLSSEPPFTHKGESLTVSPNGGIMPSLPPPRQLASPIISKDTILRYREEFQLVGTHPSDKMIYELVRKLYDLNPARHPNYALACAEWCMSLDAPTMARITKAYAALHDVDDIIGAISVGGTAIPAGSLEWLFNFYKDHSHKMPPNPNGPTPPSPRPASLMAG